MKKLEWLVVRDWFEIESACYWYKGPEGTDPKTIPTEVFFMPAATLPEKDGTLTNTQRLLQWHDQARWILRGIAGRICGSSMTWVSGSSGCTQDRSAQRDQGLLNLTWDYGYDKPNVLPDGRVSRIGDEPDAEKVLKEINGYIGGGHALR